MIPAIFFLIATTAGGTDNLYRSDAYRYSFDHQRISTFCAEKPPAPAHGFAFSTKKASCIDLKEDAKFPYVLFWAEYNVIEQADGAEELAAETCVDGSVKTREGFRGLPTFKCEAIKKGRTEIHFFAQTSDAHVAVEQRINYHATVIVPNANVDGDFIANLQRISVGE